MANYVGSVRTMVVAGQDGAYGKTEKTTPVKKPLMVLSTLPRVLGPTETVKLPVTVFAMDDAIRKVTVEVKTNELIKVIGSSRKSIDFTEQGEQVVYFDLEVNPKIGIGKVEVNVKSGKETASHAIELDVRLPNPQITQVSSGMADPGKKWTGEYQPFGV